MHLDIKIKRLVQWLENNDGHYPKQSDDPKQYALISRIRTRARLGTLKHHHRKILESVNFNFNPDTQDECWHSKLNKVINFSMLHNGKLPRMGNRNKLKEYDSKTGAWTDEKRKEEYLLGKWIMAQRTALKNGKIKPNRRKLLELTDIGIDGYKRKWLKTFDSLYSFALKENRIPLRNENQLLNDWFYRNLELFDNGELNTEKNNLFNNLTELLKSDFREKRAHMTWNERYKELEVFVNKHKKLPGKRLTITKNRDEKEISLSGWLTSQRGKWRKNKLSSSRKLKLEKLGVVFKKINHEKDWMDKFSKYCEFKKEFNREPNGWGRSKEEIKIAYWVYYNRSLYKGNFNNRQFPEHRLKLLKSIDFPFNNIAA